MDIIADIPRSSEKGPISEFSPLPTPIEVYACHRKMLIKAKFNGLAEEYTRRNIILCSVRHGRTQEGAVTLPKSRCPRIFTIFKFSNFRHLRDEIINNKIE